MQSKLPHVSTSIFTTMSMMANKYDAINLSQGFPGFDCPAYLANRAADAIANGHNQYAPSAGLPCLLEEIQVLTKRNYNRNLDIDQITVTSGATEALFVAISSIVNQGDEVIVFDPAYDSYEPVVNLFGGTCRHIELKAPDYQIDWQLVRDTINSKTKAIILNSPHNPTGSILSETDIAHLKEIVTSHGLTIISDEVYEHITFDGKQHFSMCMDETLFAHSFVISSFGKSFHITGWKVGYCIAPKTMSEEFRKLHQYMTFSTSTPMQFAIADMLKNNPQHIRELSQFYQQKRDTFVSAIKTSKFKVLPCHGTYFQLLDYSQVSLQSDIDFTSWMTQERGLATIPLSPFYQEGADGKNASVIRVCFAKPESELNQAANILNQL